ncbi:MAG: group 1 truncated hemoglobin [Planctomycetales bacterium]
MFKSKKRFTKGGVLSPCPELWAALKSGPGLTEILDDFYTRAFEDELLSSFFDGVSKKLLVEKVYSFYYQTFTGEDVYFGWRPRNAHHFMVISDEVMDRRKELLEDCLRRYELPEPWIDRWQSVDEVFRKQIVKDKPWPRKLGGVELPLEGYDDVTLTVGSLCDSCDGEINVGEINVGETARYHVRTGKTYCRACDPEAKL